MTDVEQPLFERVDGVDFFVRLVDRFYARVEADPVLATPKAKCDVYRQFVRWARQPTRAEYPRMAGGACARFPLPDELL